MTIAIEERGDLWVLVIRYSTGNPALMCVVDPLKELTDG